MSLLYVFPPLAKHPVSGGVLYMVTPGAQIMPFLLICCALNHLKVWSIERMSLTVEYVEAQETLPQNCKPKEVASLNNFAKAGHLG